MARFFSPSLVRFGYSFALIALTVVMVGCGGKAKDQPARSSRDASSTSTTPAPAFDAPADTVGRFIDGSWTITLLPEASEVDVEAPSLEASLDADTFVFDESSSWVADLSGAVGGTGTTGGRITVTDDGSAYPILEFTTPSLTLTSLTGEEMTVEGPIGWSAQLVDGQLIGTATGPDGQVSAWEGRRK